MMEEGEGAPVLPTELSGDKLGDMGEGVPVHLEQLIQQQSIQQYSTIQQFIQQ